MTSASEFWLGSWCFSIYWNPRVWGLRFHWCEPCCKFWLLAGPVEVNRIWNDDDVYPWEDEE